MLYSNTNRISISSRSSCYHQSFLPRTIRNVRGFT